MASIIYCVTVVDCICCCLLHLSAAIVGCCWHRPFACCYRCRRGPDAWLQPASAAWLQPMPMAAADCLLILLLLVLLLRTRRSQSEVVRDTSGRGPEQHVREPSERRPGAAREGSGRRSGSVREASEGRLGAVREASEERPGGVRGAPGSCPKGVQIVFQRPSWQNRARTLKQVTLPCGAV